MKPTLSTTRILLLICIAFSTVWQANTQTSGICDSLNQAVSEALQTGDFETALGLAKEAKRVCEETDGEKSIGHISALANLAGCHYYLGNDAEALQFADRSIALLTGQASGGVSKKYALLLQIHGSIQTSLGRYKPALDSLEKSLTIFQSLNLLNDPDYGQTLIYAGINCTYLGLYDIAGDYYIKAMEVAESLGEAGDILYGDAQLNRAANLEAAGRDYEALPVFELVEKKAPRDFMFGTAMINYATLCLKLGMNKEAEAKNLLGLEYTGLFFGKESRKYCFGLMNLVEIYDLQGREQAADSLMQETANLIKKVVGEEHLLYGYALNNLAQFEQRKLNYAAAGTLLRQSLAIIEKAAGKYNQEYPNVLELLADNHEKSDSIEAALALYGEAITILRDSLKITGVQYGRVLVKVGNLQARLGDFDQALLAMEEANTAFLHTLHKSFTVMNESGQEQLYIRLREFFDHIATFCLKNAGKKPELAGLLFDQVTGVKQFRLESARSARQAIQVKGGEMSGEILEEFDNWLNVRRLIAIQARMPYGQRTWDVDSLNQVAEELESFLNRQSADFRGAFARLGWQDIQKLLKKGETAIDFYQFQYKDDEQSNANVYCALLLRPNDPHPVMIRLFAQTELEESLNYVGTNLRETIETLYADRDSRLYQLIWKKLEPYLKKGETIYIAPVGLLNNIAFQALSKDNKRYLIDDYKLRQLGTSRNLARMADLKASQIATAEIYGDIIYHRHAGTHSGRTVVALAGSLPETQAIGRLCAKRNIAASVFTREKASEESFKKTGRTPPSPDVVHFSTHAFTFVSNAINLRNSHPVYTLYSKPLFNAMIVLANGGDVFAGAPPDEDQEDGLLTAYEIISLNLANTKLAVLSACSTGLGDIKDVEGGFGLQRAFHLAGVPRLIVSLWDVDDDKASIFMQAFYKNWLDTGQDEAVREAFQKTQRQMKRKYKSPMYWAGWALIE